jgi:hypothetical protein
MLMAILSTSVYSQLKVQSTGRVEIDGQGGGFLTTAPIITINSSGTGLESINTGLTLYNRNTTTNNWTRFHFATRNNDGNYEDYVSLAARYRSRGSTKEADFHIATLNRGHYDTRFSIFPGPNANYVRFFFKTGYGGAWLDDTSPPSEPTFRPHHSSTGFLGRFDRRWREVHAFEAFFVYQTVFVSDVRNKKDIQDIDEGVLDKLTKVRGVKYKMYEEKEVTADDSNLNGVQEDGARPSFSPEANEEPNRYRQKEKERRKEKEHYGFIAQELSEIFPEVVEYDELNDSYGIRYTSLIPFIIEAIKEQQEIINAQSLKIKELQQLIENPNIKSNELKSANISNDDSDTGVLNNAFLYQNSPNPFSSDTEIKYYIPKNAGESVLHVFNLQGNLMMSKNIPGKGHGAVTIHGSQLNPGMFIYALVIDGHKIDTKRMILTN